MSENNQLIGSVTDGDLRRAIISGINFEQNVSSVMNSQQSQFYTVKMKKL